MEVIPAINCHPGDLRCVEEKLRKIRGFLKDGWVHLDIADGRFTFNKTWGSPTEWANLRSEFSLEAHLMVENPEHQIKAWLAAGARRFVVHVETITSESLRAILEMVGTKAEVMLSSNPETSFAALRPYFGLVKSFQVLAVNPGFAGQKFLPAALEKIKFLRQNDPDAKIEVDGGVNLETGKLAATAGSDILISASHIFDGDDPKESYESLKRL